MNKQIWTLRGLNFSYYMPFASLLFLPILFEEKGYSASEIGLLMSIGPFVSIFAQPLWGYLSDRYQTLKFIIFGLCMMSVLTSIGIFHTTGYPLALLFMLLLNLFMSSSIPLVDTLTIKTAQKFSLNYGTVRLYGSIGFMIIALISGSLLDILGGLQNIPYLFWSLWILPMVLLLKIKDEKNTQASVSFSGLGGLLRNRQLIWFFVLVFVLMVPHRMNDAMLALHLKDLGAKDSMVGWAFALVAASEVPTFALLGRYLHKFNELILLGFVAIFYTIRWFFYGWFSDPLIITFLQSLTIITWASFWIIAVQYVTRLVPEEMRSTGQSMLSMVLVGICGVTGGYTGGWLKDLFGGAYTYQLGAVMTTLAAVLFFGTFVYNHKKKQVESFGACHEEMKQQIQGN